MLCKAQDVEIEKAELYFREGRYAKALTIYDKKIQYNHASPSTLMKAAVCLRNLNRFEEAASVYESLVEDTLLSSDSILLDYAEVLQYNNNFSSAKAYYTRYLNDHPSDINAMKGVVSCDSALFWLLLERKLEVANITALNTPYSEIAPVAFKDKLVFCGNKEETIIRKKSDKTDQPFSDLYLTERVEQGWGPPKRFSASINTGLHEGPATFSAHFDTIYFSRNGEDRTNSHLKLFSAVFKGKEWKHPSDFMLNDSTFSFAHPSISKDGNLFFFSSDIPGGFGGTDLYVCVKADSNWSYPINLGGTINTKGNEIFPCYTTEGNLYFSSDGHLGMGGFDIFFAEQYDGDWKKPQHLMPPVNSGADDFSFIPFPAWPYGMFSSNRNGGKGNEDLYSVSPVR